MTRRSFARRWTALLLPLVLAGCGAGLLPAIHSEGERLSVARKWRWSALARFKRN